jgi:hypothetical protein
MALAFGSGGEHVEVGVSPLKMIGESLRDMGLPLSGPGLLLAVLPWLVACLGLRTAGLAAAGRALRGGSPAAAALAVIALSGWPLGLLFHVAARDLDGNPLPSATIYFMEQAGAVLWIFTAMTLAPWVSARRRPAFALAALALLTLPSTAELAWRKTQVSAERIPAATMRALAALAAAGQPGDVVLQRPSARRPPLPVILTGRRVVFERFTPYLTQFAPRPELQERERALLRFFRTPDAQEGLEIARRFGARFLCLYGPNHVRFDLDEIATVVHHEPDARVYRFAPAADD